MRTSFKVTYQFKPQHSKVPKEFTEYAFSGGLRKLLARLKREGATEIKTHRLERVAVSGKAGAL